MEIRNDTQSNDGLAYKVGSLLYVPALNYKAIAKIINKGIHGAMSIALCLEDSIDDSAVDAAESKVLETFDAISRSERADAEMPLYFIRVRDPKQMRNIADGLGSAINSLCGFILPKFDVNYAEEYIEEIKRVNNLGYIRNKVYIMPVLETPSIAFIETRRDVLYSLKEILVSNRGYILNIRIGGNDLCNIFGVRVCAGQTIYGIGVIRDILGDVINFFGRDFIVSAPTSNYFSGESEINNAQWEEEIAKEIRIDILNGFIGKTAIHPSQIPIINKSFMVDWNDYYDAQQIMNWPNVELAVTKSVSCERMNERKVHSNWANRIINRANVYGIRE
jgi:citrate lyase beta subunit